jgi:integrase
MKLYPEAFNIYKDTSGRLRTKHSAAGFETITRLLQQEHPTLPVDRFTEQHLAEFCLGGGKLAPNTIRNRKTTITAVFNWLHYAGIVKTNPAAGLKYRVQVPPRPVRQHTWLDEHDAGRILKACPDTFQGQRDQLILMFGFLMGLRLGAITDLTWDKFDNDLRVLHLTVKGGKQTHKGVPAQLRSRLEQWKQQAPVDAVAVLPGIKWLSFPEPSMRIDWSRPLGRTGVVKAVNTAGERIGVHLAPHDMRRTCAAIMEAQGAPVTKIQRALDHSNVGTTSIYLDQNPNRTIEATEGANIAF